MNIRMDPLPGLFTRPPFDNFLNSITATSCSGEMVNDIAPWTFPFRVSIISNWLGDSSDDKIAPSSCKSHFIASKCSFIRSFFLAVADKWYFAAYAGTGFYQVHPEKVPSDWNWYQLSGGSRTPTPNAPVVVVVDVTQTKLFYLGHGDNPPKVEPDYQHIQRRFVNWKRTRYKSTTSHTRDAIFVILQMLLILQKLRTGAL